MIKKVLKSIGVILLALVLFVAAFFIYATIREYRPEPYESLGVPEGTKELSLDQSFVIATYNIGYGALSVNEDFFMDGGTKVAPDSISLVQENMSGIAGTIGAMNPDFLFLQEVDLDSKRSFHIDECQYLEDTLGVPGVHALNFKADFVPYPIPPIGKVTSGLFTMTDYRVSHAARISLPESFSWPIKTCNLKRCMLEIRIPIEDTDKELVLINFHLEAYDDGEGKLAQTKILNEKLAEEYAKGNYVIAGGDFNQTLPTETGYPLHNLEDWVPGTFDVSSLPEGFSVAATDNAPTCRLLNAPYSGNYTDSQVYVIDGFLVSDNLIVTDISVIDIGFAYTDHQPVRMEVEFVQ